MARKPMVTRTIQSTVATIACYNTVTNEMVTHELELARTYANNDKLMKAATPVLEPENLKPVHVLKTEVIRTLYGMPEQSFIEHAEKLTDSEAVEPEN